MMPVREILMKTAAIVMFAVATILALHGEKMFRPAPHHAKYLFFASIVLALAGTFFFVFPMTKDMSFMRKTRKSSDRQKP